MNLLQRIMNNYNNKVNRNENKNNKQTNFLAKAFFYSAFSCCTCVVWLSVLKLDLTKKKREEHFKQVLFWQKLLTKQQH